MRASLATVGLVAAVAAAACGGKSADTATPPPPARPIAGLADLEGTWQATDPDGWRFELRITGGRFTQQVQRTTLGACAQRGTVSEFEAAFGQRFDPAALGGTTYGAPRGEPPYAFAMTMEENACNPAYAGAPLIVLATEYHGDSVTLRTGVGHGGAEETRRYRRVPAAPR